MTTKELETLIDERTKKQIEDAKASIKSEMGGVANITDENKFNEAVEKAVGKVLEENKKSLEDNANMLLNFEKANAENAMKGLKKETSTTVVNEMIGSYLKAMNDKNAMNVKQVTPDEALETAKKLYPNSKALHAVLGQKIATANVPADGGFTVPIAFSPDYIKALYSNTILEKLGVPFQIVNESRIFVNGQTERSAEINTALVTSGLAVSELAVKGEALEDYYLNLTGGARNA
jgi:hypothetical protein